LAWLAALVKKDGAHPMIMELMLLSYRPVSRR